MAAINKELQAVLDNYAKSVGGVSSANYKNVVDVINGSPELLNKMNEAAHNHTLKTIKQDPSLAARGAGAEYSSTSQTMKLGNTTNLKTLVFQMGHEIKHAANAKDTKLASDTAWQNMNTKAGSLDATHDYTSIIKTVLVQNRKDEASAHLAGWNAYVSYMQTQTPGISLQKLAKDCPYQANYFDIGVDKNGNQIYNLKSNLTLTSDNKINVSNSQNVDAMGKYYFDNGGSFGSANNLNYTNYYGKHYLQLVAFAENNHRVEYRHTHGGNAAQVAINMSALGLSEAKIEKNTFAIPGGHLAFRDTSGKGHNSSLDGTSPAGTKFNPITPALASEGKSPTLSPPANANSREWFDHLHASLKSGNPDAFAEATKSVANSDIGQQFRAESVKAVDSKEQAQSIANPQALEVSKALEATSQRGPRL